jgi:hypothetical protein
VLGMVEGQGVRRRRKRGGDGGVRRNDELGVRGKQEE